ncbi:efflux RND transporter periplasmic adaptor subunit [Sphingomonas crocodyli]|uniref:HlyD family efflux transporter periplasmic adaptor subunit n=1 Tax=Sphingomonas crocodyli TaxID=1979270 RepID=A0A437M0J5_9SPHN|nr:efflux RND transporter periplasmic adaptor subunit [Sphingomonas crocodyli]RVT91034.1 HlyD family efflux transporter periplasmic adaptor subunit [Sphingomonas crocodyli]
MTDNSSSRPDPVDDASVPGATPPAAPPVDETEGKSNTRKRAFLILGVVVLLGLIAWGVHAIFFAGDVQETDDAYVAGDIVAITSREPATVLAIHADNTEGVKAGDPLIDLDPAQSDVSLAQAGAELARAVRSVRSNFSAVDEGKAAVAQAQAELAKARNDLGRRQRAAADGAVSGEEVAHARDAVTTANAALQLAQSRLAQARTSVQGASVETNPAVLAAIARYRTAAISRGHMHLTAPVDGVIAQRSVQLGQQVAPGTPLMAVVPLDKVWIDANFRETQLRNIRIGQPATVTADVYGDDAVYHGHVIGLGAGTGNAFALLPPQNASGNWIKIVQRLPVRIALNPKELREHPLRIGMSVMAEVDVTDRSGPLLAQPASGGFQSKQSDALGAGVEADIQRIIAANRGTGR